MTSKFESDIIFDNIVEQIKNKNNCLYEFEVIDEKPDYESHIKYIKLLSNEEESESFIVNETNQKLIGRKIKFHVNFLKIRIINSRPYFLIMNYKSENNNIKSQKLLKNLRSNSYEIITSNKEIKPNYLYTLILRAKEIKKKTQQYIFQLEDINRNPVIIEQLENFEFENKKLYCFHGYIYNNLTLKIEPTNISFIEEFSTSMLRINNAKEISESKVNSLLHLKGKVKSFSIMDNVIIIENENKITYKLNVNYHLIKQICLNNECKFYNFFKLNNNEFNFSNLSIIEAKEYTYIDFNFPFFESEEKYYNKIKINDKYYDINKKSIRVPVDDKEKSNLFFQKVRYEKTFEEKILDSYTFDLELDKGKIYSLITSSEKGGFSYEFLIQSDEENNLPANLSFQFKNKTFTYKNPDKNCNRLKERFTVINFPKQDVKTVLGLSGNDIIIEDKYNYKYLLMINNNNKKILNQFRKIEPKDDKKDFCVPKDIEETLEKASAQCYINFNENNEDQLYNINKNDIQIFIKLLFEIFKGFQNLRFENTKRHYKIIKDITAFSLNYYASVLFGKYYSFRKNYEILLDSMLNLEYIDRIKILISFLVKIMKSITEKNIEYDMFHLIDIDNVISYDKYPYIKDAYDIFYTIIDNLTEDSALFKAIDQFNSVIYKDVISGEIIHSGSILNLNDIKLELVKNLNRFFFISEKSRYACEDYANFEKNGLLVTFNIFSFSDQEEIIDENNFKKLESIVLFLLFHECLGHQKKHINNEKAMTPRKHYKCDFQEFSLENVDTGLALEIILIGKVVNIKYLMNSINSENLLEPKLYTGKDFNKLKDIYLSIEKDNIINKDNESNIQNRFDAENKNKAKVQKNNKLREKHQHLMYRELFVLYSGISEKEKIELKDDEDYQRFLKIYKMRHQDPSEYLTKELLDFRLFHKKYKK